MQRVFVGVLKATFRAWNEDKCSRTAAALAYFALFAIAPLLIVAIQIGALWYGGAGHHREIEDELLRNVRPALGDDGVNAISAIVAASYKARSQGTFASILGVIVFVVAATGFVGALEEALQSVWHVQAHRTIAAAFLGRVKGFAVIAATGCFAAASLALLHIVGIDGSSPFAVIVQGLATVVLVTVVLAFLYKFMASIALSWSGVLRGSLLSAVLIVVGQYAIGAYLSHVSLGSAFGAAGSIAVILVWLFYTAQVFLLGAEFTKVLTSRPA